MPIYFQNATDHENIPSEQEFIQWGKAALEAAGIEEENIEVTVKLVSNDESQQLNKRFRKKDKPTNVLSFPHLDEEEPNYLGDIAICVDIVKQEANQQNKPEPHHFAHMTIHGILHLLGYDHQQDEEAEVMENLEASILKHLFNSVDLNPC